MASKRAGSLLVDVALNVAKVSSDINGLNKKFDKFGKDINNTFTKLGKAMAGAFSVMAIKAAASSMAQMYEEVVTAADATTKLAGRLGVSTEALSNLEYAAKMAGTEVGQLHKGLVSMQDAVADAARGTGEAKDALDRLGLDVNALMQLSPDQMFVSIAEAMKNVTNQNERMNYAIDIFGKRQSSLMTLIMEGEEGLRSYNEELKRLGGGLTTDLGKKSEEASDAIDRLSTAWENFKRTIAENFVDDVTDAINDLAYAIGYLSGKIKDTIIITKILHEAFELIPTQMNQAQLAVEIVSKGMYNTYKDRIDKILDLYEQLNTAADATTQSGGKHIIDIRPRETTALVGEEGLDKFASSASEIGELNRVLQANLDIADQFGETYAEASAASLGFKNSMVEIVMSADLVTGTARSMEYGFSDAFTNLVTGTGTVQDAFASMGRSIIGVLGNMIAKLLIANLLMKAIGLVLGASSSGTAGVQADLGPGYDINKIADGLSLAHKGGMVTKAGIRQYHRGGAIQPLRPDEVPAILQVGERVIPKSGATQQAPVTEVHIHNEGDPMSVRKQQTRTEQGRTVMDLWLEVMNTDPSMRQRASQSMGRR